MAMNRGLRIGLVVGALMLGLAAVGATLAWRWFGLQQATAAELDPEQARRAQHFIALLDAGEFGEAHALFSPEVRKQLSAPELEAVWRGLSLKFGERGPLGPARGEALGQYRFVTFALPFKMMTLDARVGIDERGDIAGFRLVPAAIAAAPPPAQDASYVERDLALGEGEDGLPGTLTLPKGDGPFPAALLVHGSGPLDRDASLGPNKPFVDIARGLAAQGIAVLRYEKRTHAHPVAFTPTSTVDDETVNDAVAAVALLRATDGIDPERVYVVGHSLGAMMAPRIAQRAPETAGIVMLAAPARALEDIVADQMQYLATVDGKLSPEDRDMLRDMEERRDRVKKLIRGEPYDGPLLLNMSPAYWQHLSAYDPVATLAAIPQRALIVQGTMDYQVLATADYARWRERFGNEPRVAFREYAGLNHLFMPITGRPKPEDYLKPGHVAPEVVVAVADWILDTPP